MSRIPNSVMPHSFVPEAHIPAPSKPNPASRMIKIATAPAVFTLGLSVIALSSLTALLTNRAPAAAKGSRN